MVRIAPVAAPRAFRTETLPELTKGLPLGSATVPPNSTDEKVEILAEAQVMSAPLLVWPVVISVSRIRITDVALSQRKLPSLPLREHDEPRKEAKEAHLLFAERSHSRNLLGAEETSPVAVRLVARSPVSSAVTADTAAMVAARVACYFVVSGNEGPLFPLRPCRGFEEGPLPEFIHAERRVYALMHTCQAAKQRYQEYQNGDYQYPIQYRIEPRRE